MREIDVVELICVGNVRRSVYVTVEVKSLVLIRQRRIYLLG